MVLQEDAAIEVETERMRRELLAEGAIHEDVVVPEPVGDVVLSLQGLHAGYEAVEVLHGIDFAVRRGEITVLLGANGSGKTTLCSTISGARAGPVGLDQAARRRRVEHAGLPACPQRRARGARSRAASSPACRSRRT